MKMITLSLALVTTLISLSHAEVCSHIYTPHHLYNEAMKRSIHLEIKELENKALEGQITDASKIFNPEFEHFTTTGDQFGKTNVTSESRIWFNIQLNDKRSKKTRVAEAQKELGQVELEHLRLKLKQEIFLAILRFKQIHREMGAVKNPRPEDFLKSIGQMMLHSYRT
ncbi:MAG: TolC family protein [Bacteriovoracaceae bacterium]